MAQVFQLVQEATQSSLHLSEELKKQAGFEISNVQIAMKERAVALQKLEDFIASDEWAKEKSTVDEPLLREQFNELLSLDEEIKKALQNRSRIQETQRDDVQKELKAQNSYTQGGKQQKPSSVFFENKLHG